MARPTTLRGSLMLIEIGDGASPEVFTAPCALDAKSFNRSASMNEFNVADCDDPDAPVWVERVKAALTAGISGSGTLAEESLDTYEALFADVDPRNIRITLDYPAGARQYVGLFHLETLNLSGNNAELVQVELSFVSHGEVEALSP